MSEENIAAPNTSDYSLNPQLSYLGYKTRVVFKKSCLKQDKTTYDHEKLLNIYILHEINKNFNISSHAIQENCLFGTVSLTKNLDIDKYEYSGYGIGFDRHRFFSHPRAETGRNAIIFDIDMSLSTKIDNKKNIFWFLVRPCTRVRTYTVSRKNVFN